LLAMVGPLAVQVATGTLVVTIGGGQVMVTQPLPELPVCGVQVSTGMELPIRTLHSVVVQPLAAVGASGTQVPEGICTLRTAQRVVWKLLPALPVTGVQVCTWVGPLTGVAAGQVVVVKPLPAVGPEAEQVPTATLVVLLVPQVVVVQRLPAVGPEPAQLDTPVGPVVTGAGHVVVVQLLPEVGPEAAHDDTGVLVRTSVGQVVDVQLLPEVAADAVQLEIGVGPVVTGAGQVVAVQELPALAIDAVQDRTATFVVLFGVQVVEIQPLSEVAAAATQFCTPTGPVVTAAGQVVVV